MPLGKRFGIGIAVGVGTVLALCCGLLAREWAAYRLADEALQRFDSFKATLLAMEKVSAERGPMNGVLGEDQPIPAARLAALAHARRASDDAIAQLSEDLSPQRCPSCASERWAIARLRVDLAAARASANRLAALPRTQRDDAAVQQTVEGMFAVIPEFAPVAATETAAITEGDGGSLHDLILARLAADLREHAGRLGSLFTRALAAHRAVTDDERLAIERTRGRIDELRALIDAHVRTSNALERDAFAEVSTRYFGDGLDYVADVETMARQPGGAPLTTGQFAEHYVPMMAPIPAYRDAVLSRAGATLSLHCRQALAAVIGTILADALVLLTLGWLVAKFRRDIVSPFVEATYAIQAIAKGDLTRALPAAFAREEVRELFDAIRVLKANTAERAELEAERARLLLELSTMAQTDPLTRLANRRAFEDRARRLCLQADDGTTHVALIMFDVDHFKRINDTFGHAVGDDALRTIAQLCRAQWDDTDPPAVVARIGGEEFAVCLRTRAPDAVVAATEQMRSRILEAVVPTDSPIGCAMTASFGIAFTPHYAGPELTGLLKRADSLLYQAKLAGRNRVHSDPAPGSVETVVFTAPSNTTLF